MQRATKDKLRVVWVVFNAIVVIAILAVAIRYVGYSNERVAVEGYIHARPRHYDYDWFDSILYFAGFAFIVISAIAAMVLTVFGAIGLYSRIEQWFNK